MSRKIVYQGIELEMIRGHVTGPHYHEVVFRCTLCGHVQRGLCLCGTKLEQIATAVECEQCTKNNMYLAIIETTYCWVPQIKKP